MRNSSVPSRADRGPIPPWRPAAALVLAAGLGTGAWLLSADLEWRPPPQPPAADRSVADRPVAERDFVRPPEGDRGAAEAGPSPSSVPVRVRIPAIGVDAPVTGLGLRPDGTLASPPQDRPGLTGWFRDGTAPGTAGTAVLAGHVDAQGGGRAVFYRLGALRPGDTVEVQRQDGARVVFTLYAVEVFEGADFPDEVVYGSTGYPEIRLITCGGEFSAERNEYLSNIVAFGVLSDAR
jgi:sortase (surface protein transpeptidase)